MRRIRYLLVTTQLFNQEASSKNIIFLNEFSKTYNSIKNDQKKNITIDHPWIDEKKKHRDERYVLTVQWLSGTLYPSNAPTRERRSSWDLMVVSHVE